MKNPILNKKLIVLLITLLTSYTLSSQIYNGDLTLSTQNQVNAFNYTEINGNLIIGEFMKSDITDITPLKNLTTVGGLLCIRYNTSLTNLSGLENLTSVDFLEIFYNASLTSLSGLDNLTSVGDLRITFNESLTTLTGLDNLSNVLGVVRIYNNVALHGLSGLDNLTTVGGDLIIGQIPLLTSLSGLDNLTSVGGDLDIYANDDMASLSGLNNLTSVVGYLRIYGNHALSNLFGLENLTSVGGDLIIGKIPLLTSLSGLDNLTTVGAYLRIYSNHVLSSLSGLDNLTSVGGNLQINNNDALIGFCGLYHVLSTAGLTGTYNVYDNVLNPTKDDIIAGGPCISTIFDGSLTLLNQAQIDAFPYTEIKGFLTISGIDITYLTPLIKLSSVGGIIVKNNSALESLAGLDNLKSMSSLDIENNTSLTNLSGFSNLKSLTRNLSINHNDALIDLSGLDNLTSVGGGLKIEHNHALTSLNVLDNLTSVGYLSIWDNDALTSLSGLDNLNSMGSLSIWDNDALTSLSVLDNITTLTGLIVSNNSSLTSLAGLDNVTSVPDEFMITSNSSLTSFCSLYTLVSTGGDLNGNYNVYANAVNPTFQEIIDGGSCSGNTDPITTQTWTQIGADIDGEAAGDYSGHSVSLSGDGSVVAIGAWGNDGNGTDSGHARVFKYNSGSWTQIGDDIDGEATGDYSGHTICLSKDGSVLAIGAYANQVNGFYSGHVRIFKNNAGAWTQIGADIDSEANYDHFGQAISLSNNGSVVAIGARYRNGNRGYVKVFENISGSWVQIGEDINGEDINGWTGYSVSLNSDGSVLAIGSDFTDGQNNPGNVKVYKNISGSWTQIGDDIIGEANQDHFGCSVSLSSDGSVLAVGAWGNDGNGSNSGHVRVYENNSGSWTQIGDDIDGEAAGDWSGQPVSLSSDGSVVAIGAWFNDGNGTDSGHVRVFENNSGSWTQKEDDIDGEAAGDNSGISVSLSSDGSVVAIGAYKNDENGSNSGNVRVYSLNNELSPVALCKDTNVQLDDSGNGFIEASDVDNGSTATNGIASLTVLPNTFSCSDIGLNTVTLTVTDVDDNVSTCDATVTVIDGGCPPPPECLILWNKLGSETEVTNSKVGPDLESSSRTEFSSGEFGNCLTLSGSGHNVIFNNVNEYIDLEKGTIECWFKQMTDPVPYQHNDYRIFDGSFGLYSGIWFQSIFWGVDGLSEGRLHFEISPDRNSYGGARSLIDNKPGVNISQYNGTFIHVAGVWDKNGINGTNETMQIYINGEKAAATDFNNWRTTPFGSKADIGGGNDGGIAHKFYIDNLKIWSYAKTDFSDRYEEGIGDIECPGFPVPGIKTDSLALVALYNATDGANWINKDNWLNGPVSSWYGITVENGRVIEIKLNKNNLTGEIPSDLAKIKNLKWLYLVGNNLSGTIPSELGQLQNLRMLYMANNDLVGTIPSEIGQLQNLRYLRLNLNQLSGAIPSELGQLSNLRYLNVQNNNLSGAIPVGLCNLPLTYAHFTGNNFDSDGCPAIQCMVDNGIEFGDDGQIQQSDFSLLVDCGNNLSSCNHTDSLALVTLYNSTDGTNWTNNTNWLSGPVSTWYGITVDNGRVIEIKLNSNNLTGEIPSELGNIENLIWLYLNINNLSGTIPPELGQLQNLQQLILDCNDLSGTIPAELGQLHNLKYLRLNRNQLSGAIPSELEQLSNLKNLYIHDNNFSGTIPVGLCSLPLSNVHFRGNNFDSGSCPTIRCLSDNGVHFVDTEQIQKSGLSLLNDCGTKSAEIDMTFDAPVRTPEIQAADLNVYPNPFSDELIFEFMTVEDEYAVLEMYNLSGQSIVRLYDQWTEGGEMNRIEYAPTEIISGIYIYRLTLNNNVLLGNVIYNKY